MRYIRFDNLQRSRPANPLVQLLGLIVGFVLFVAAVLLGGIVLAAIIGFFLMAGVVIYVRIWWLTRKAGLNRQGGRRPGHRENTYVEAEYKVVDPSQPDDERP